MLIIEGLFLPNIEIFTSKPTNQGCAPFVPAIMGISISLEPLLYDEILGFEIIRANAKSVYERIGTYYTAGKISCIYTSY